MVDPIDPKQEIIDLENHIRLTFDELETFLDNEYEDKNQLERQLSEQKTTIKELRRIGLRSYKQKSLDTKLKQMDKQCVELKTTVNTLNKRLTSKIMANESLRKQIQDMDTIQTKDNTKEILLSAEEVTKKIDESELSPFIKDILQRMIETHSIQSIPVRINRFNNFVRNSLHITNHYYIEQMWKFFSDNVIEPQINDNVDQSQPNESPESLVLSADVTENGANGNNEAEESKPKLNIKKIIVKIIKQSENNEMNVKKLKKKVIKTCKSIDENLTDEDIETKFNNKLKKTKKIEINGRIVSLKHK